MPGKRITDQQIRLYMKARKEGHTQMAAGAKAAVSERTARRIDVGQLSTEVSKKRHWRTREDPLADVWTQELEPLLDKNPALLPVTLLEFLCDNYPNRYDNKILRTLQRRIKSWKAKHGPAKDVMFRQIKVPGRLGLSDFTWLKDATITLDGVVFTVKLGRQGTKNGNLAASLNLTSSVREPNHALAAVNGTLCCRVARIAVTRLCFASLVVAPLGYNILHVRLGVGLAEPGLFPLGPVRR